MMTFNAGNLVRTLSVATTFTDGSVSVYDEFDCRKACVWIRHDRGTLTIFATNGHHALMQKGKVFYIETEDNAPPVQIWRMLPAEVKIVCQMLKAHGKCALIWRNVANMLKEYEAREPKTLDDLLTFEQSLSPASHTFDKTFTMPWESFAVVMDAAKKYKLDSNGLRCEMHVKGKDLYCYVFTAPDFDPDFKCWVMGMIEPENN